MARKLRRAKDPLEYKATPMKGASKRQIDLALGAIKLGSSVVSLMSGLLAAVLILYSSYVLYDTFSTSYGAYKSSWDLLQYKPEIVDDGATPSDGRDTLASINKDYRGWLTVYDTGIDYPVVQGENDLYYASHDVYGNVSLTGAIYLAAGNTRNGSDSYNLIYGHHMDNGAMFGRLDSFQTQSYFNEHRQGIWVTESGVYDLYAFALVTTDAYENEIYSVGNRAALVRAFRYYWTYRKESPLAATPLAFCTVFILVGLFESVYAPFSFIGCNFFLVQGPLWRADLLNRG